MGLFSSIHPFFFLGGGGEGGGRGKLIRERRGEKFRLFNIDNTPGWTTWTQVEEFLRYVSRAANEKKPLSQLLKRKKKCCRIKFHHKILSPQEQTSFSKICGMRCSKLELPHPSDLEKRKKERPGRLFYTKLCVSSDFLGLHRPNNAG